VKVVYGGSCKETLKWEYTVQQDASIKYSINNSSVVLLNIKIPPQTLTVLTTEFRSKSDIRETKVLKVNP
jgi:hypothetical protein